MCKTVGWLCLCFSQFFLKCPVLRYLKQTLLPFKKSIFLRHFWWIVDIHPKSDFVNRINNWCCSLCISVWFHSSPWVVVNSTDSCGKVSSFHFIFIFFSDLNVPKNWIRQELDLMFHKVHDVTEVWFTFFFFFFFFFSNIKVLFFNFFLSLKGRN